MNPQSGQHKLHSRTNQRGHSGYLTDNRENLRPARVDAVRRSTETGSISAARSWARRRLRFEPSVIVRIPESLTTGLGHPRSASPASTVDETDEARRVTMRELLYLSERKLNDMFLEAGRLPGVRARGVDASVSFLGATAKGLQIINSLF